MSVKIDHRKSDTRPQGRVGVTLLESLIGWFLSVPIVRWVAAIKRRVQRINHPIATIFSPPVSQDPPDLEDSPLTIVSANLWHDWPRFRQLPERLESFARMIEEQGAQVVLLQEALRTPQFSASDWLAERLNMSQVYVRANGHQSAIGFEEGAAVLTSFPLTAAEALPLRSSAGPLVRRMALGARLELGCCQVWVVSTHLGFLRRDNQRQIETLRSWVGDLAGPEMAVIGGDFNVGEASHQIRTVKTHWHDTYREMHPDGESSTHQISWPWGGPLRRQRLDYLFLQAGKSAWRVTDARHLTTEPLAHSDHKAVLARLQHTTFHEHSIHQN
ncbi:MAG: endonuclease/exonuclease/phosphatase family protein [Anaerolineales bacterium]|nr:MAG: endonuclease/exonuclease/phosphatase family protein [Anaerolineales bacterium]